LAQYKALIAIRLLGENVLFDILDRGLDAVEDRKVAIDHGIHQRVQHIPGTMAQKLGLLLATGAHVGEAALGARANREHVLVPGENRHFTDVELAVAALDQMQHDEEGAVIFFDFWALMTMLGVFDGELVQTKFLLHYRQLVRFGIFDSNPDETVGTGDVRADLADGDVGELPAVLVRDAVDDHEWLARRQSRGR
jgi:hypothetical protein